MTSVARLICCFWLALLSSAFIAPLAASSTQACGSQCVCTLVSAQDTDPNGPSCLGSLVFSVTGIVNGCCNTNLCTGQTASTCAYDISFTGTSNPGIQCCFGVYYNGIFQAGALGTLNFTSPNEFPLACGAGDTWEIKVGNSPGGGTPCALPLPGGFFKVLEVSVGCTTGARC